MVNYMCRFEAHGTSQSHGSPSFGSLAEVPIHQGPARSGILTRPTWVGWTAKRSWRRDINMGGTIGPSGRLQGVLSWSGPLAGSRRFVMVYPLLAVKWGGLLIIVIVAPRWG